MWKRVGQWVSVGEPTHLETFQDREWIHYEPRWSKDSAGRAFLKAGDSTTVSPDDSQKDRVGLGVGSYADVDEFSVVSEGEEENPRLEEEAGEEFEGEEPVGGEDSERFELDKEDEFIRKLVDPKLPTAEELRIHRVRGHVDYRNWCPVCVSSREVRR